MPAIRRARFVVVVVAACLVLGPGCLAGAKKPSATGLADRRIGEFLLRWIEKRHEKPFEGALGTARPIIPLEKNGSTERTEPASRVLRFSVFDRTMSVPESTTEMAFFSSAAVDPPGHLSMRGEGWLFMHRGPGPRLDDYMHDSLVLGTVKLVTPGLVAAGVEPEKAKQACERAEAKLARLSEEALLREFVKWNATALKQTTDPMEAARLASIGNERASGALGPGAVRYVKIGSQTVYIVPEPVTGPEKKEQYLLLAYDESGAIAWDADITFFEEFEGGKRSKIPIIMQLIGTPYQYNGGKGVEHNQPVDAQAHSPQALCWQRLQNP